MSYIEFNIRIFLFTLLMCASIVVIGIWFYNLSKTNNWFTKKWKTMVIILLIICILWCLLIFSYSVTSYAKSSDEYKEVEIVQIIENDGFGGFLALKSFTIYYKDKDIESSGRINIFSSNKYKRKIMDLCIGDRIKIKITGGFNYIYDIEKI